MLFTIYEVILDPLQVHFTKKGLIVSFFSFKSNLLEKISLNLFSGCELSCIQFEV